MSKTILKVKIVIIDRKLKKPRPLIDIHTNMDLKSIAILGLIKKGSL
jgi:hypothetical protein